MYFPKKVMADIFILDATLQLGETAKKKNWNATTS